MGAVSVSGAVDAVVVVVVVVVAIVVVAIVVGADVVDVAGVPVLPSNGARRNSPMPESLSLKDTEPPSDVIATYSVAPFSVPPSAFL